MMPKTFPCPHCNKETALADSTLDLPTVIDYYHEHKIPYMERLEAGRLEWCCKACMEKQGMVVANWKIQERMGYLCYPWFAILFYKSQEKPCKVCKSTFLFSVEEQRYWYETAKIFTDVAPKMCLPCRKKAKFVKSINAELQPLLKAVENNPTRDQLLRIVELYLRLGNKRKAGMYRARLGGLKA